MNNIYVWLEEVCSPLKYRPDHDAAYRELRDHYQDHLDCLKEQGVRPNAAELQALKAMGDASEMRRLMAAAYRPLLTLLWRISRVVLVLMAVAVVLSGIWAVIGQGEGWSLKQLFDDPAERVLNTMAFYKNRDPETQIVEGRSYDMAELGEFKYSIVRALKCRAKNQYEPEIYDQFIVLILKINSPLELDATTEEFRYYLTAKDDKGLSYESAYLYEHPGGRYPERYVITGGGTDRMNSRYIAINIYNTDQDVEWIELSYDHWGKSFSLRASFDEEASE